MITTVVGRKTGGVQEVTVQDIEKGLIGWMISHLKKAGWAIDYVHDGGSATKVRTKKAALDIVFSVGLSHIAFRNKMGAKHLVAIVLGNDGYDCLADYSYADNDDFDKVMNEVIEYANKVAEDMIPPSMLH